MSKLLPLLDREPVLATLIATGTKWPTVVLTLVRITVIGVESTDTRCCRSQTEFAPKGTNAHYRDAELIHWGTQCEWASRIELHLITSESAHLYGSNGRGAEHLSVGGFISPILLLIGLPQKCHCFREERGRYFTMPIIASLNQRGHWPRNLNRIPVVQVTARYFSETNISPASQTGNSIRVQRLWVNCNCANRSDGRQRKNVRAGQTVATVCEF